MPRGALLGAGDKIGRGIGGRFGIHPPGSQTSGGSTPGITPASGVTTGTTTDVGTGSMPAWMLPQGMGGGQVDTFGNPAPLFPSSPTTDALIGQSPLPFSSEIGQLDALNPVPGVTQEGDQSQPAQPQPDTNSNADVMKEQMWRALFGNIGSTPKYTE